MPHPARGFTLIEVMIVMLIIGLLYGVAVLTLGNPRADALEQSAARLRASLALARDEAVIRGTALGLRVTPRRYTFLQQTPEGAWEPLVEDRALGARELPAFMRARIRVADTPGDIETAEDQAAEDGVRPQAVLLPAVGMTPFTVTLEAEDVAGAWVIEGRIDGSISVAH